MSSKIAIFFAIVALPNQSAQRKDQITRRRQSGAEHSAPELLKSTAVAWVWIPVCPCFQACLNFRPRPRSNAWTALRRTLNQQLRLLESRPEPPNHAEVRSYVSLANSEYSVSRFQANQGNRIQQPRPRLQPNQSISHRPSQQPENCGDPVQALGKRRPVSTQQPSCRTSRLGHAGQESAAEILRIARKFTD